MINKLKFSVTFPSNSVTLQQDLTFEPGLTAITGENGSGKTFGSIEMFRYMLFGKKALRGPAGDYKTLSGEMDVEIGGVAFNIQRNRRTEQLKGGDQILAVGAEAVNKRLLEELGFSLDVFDLACAAMQKQSDRLSQMAPTARKKLIDEIVGLTANEAVEKDCKSEALLSEREADALRGVLVEPVKPVKPKGYVAAHDLTAELAIHRSELAKRETLRRKAQAPASPAEPEVDRPFEDRIAELQDLEAERLAQTARLAAAMSELSRLAPADYTEAFLDSEEEAVGALEDYQSALQRRGPAPMLSAAEIQEMETIHAEREALIRIGTTEVMCPECDHRFCPATTIPGVPELSLAQLKEQTAAHLRHAEPLPSAPPSPPTLSLQEIRAQRQRLGNAERIEQLQQILLEPVAADQSQDLLALTEARTRWHIYDTSLAQAQAAQASAAAAQAELDALPAMTDETAVLNDLLIEARVYEAALKSYEAASEVYLQTSDKVIAAATRGANFREGVKALSETRKKLKGFLAPSLSRVASSLISDMTGGTLSSVIVDEDMNITVNGQDIATLNGAGSTAANLALRIGLGQVLVREKFAVFIADEADSDMSETRARMTMDCLASLVGNMKQIFVITHKDADFADQVIDMN